MNQPAEPEEELRVLIQKVARRIRAERAESDISDMQLSVLWKVATGGRHTPGSLAEVEHVSPPSMNRTVNALESAGYVRRELSEADARQVLVTITPLGEALLNETRRRRSAWFHEQLEELTSEQRRALEAVRPILRTLADA